MTRKPVFWIVFVLLFIGSVLFALKYFSSAYPIVTLDLKMDREAALASAKQLSEQNHWEPEGFRQAATFSLDTEVQHFVELETGGPEAFSRMLKEKLYVPYAWRIRHFKESETNETLIRFTPEGMPYGFVEKLAEDAPGASLSAQSAQKIAEKTATEKWSVDLTAFKLVEKSKEIRPGNRVDHTFVYERPDVQIGEGLYRLRLVVSGDQLTELTHFVKIPEAFTRKYQEMRSANDTIAMSALAAMAIFYVIGGCIVGLFLLLKQRWILWRKALFWGILIAFLLVLVQVNHLPLAWMDYDTALSAQGFLLQQIVQMLVIFMGMGLLLTLTFMAAEGLTRKAFPHHIQLWRFWSSDTAGSPAIFGRTIGGYLAVGLFFAFDVALYFFATKVLGWWTPSEALFQPDVLATYFPWLTSIAISLHAGFWEECMFRAIPIAGAALLGQRFGHRRIWIIGAFIIQALIFGGGHANYPQQPAYARVVELIIPSIGFGLIYLYFGLLPVIILHFAVDVAYIAMPLFVSSASGIWVDRTIVVILTLIPLFILIWRRIRARKWQAVRETDYNRSWKPPEKAKPKPVETKPEKIPSLDSKRCWLMIVAGIVGLMLWNFNSNFKNIAPPLNLKRNEAEQIAQQIMEERNIELSKPWQLLSTVQRPMGEDDRFIWQNESEEMYQSLLGSYLTVPAWMLRFVQFEGDVAERAEEYQIATTERVNRFSHILPEARKGSSLTEQSARKIAHKVLFDLYQLDATKLKAVSAEPSKLPERTDWLFTFADTVNISLKDGEARIDAKIAGNEVSDTYRYIHVPEEWEREERNRENMTQIIQIIVILTIFVIFIVGVIGASIQWSKKMFSLPAFLTFLILLFTVGIINQINRWPSVMVKFSTAEPLSNQKLMAVLIPLIGLVFLSAALSLVIGFVTAWKTRQPRSKNPAITVLCGFALGTLISGIKALVTTWFRPSLEPLWADYTALSNWIPILRDGFGPITNYILGTALILLVIIAIDRFSHKWTQRRVIFAILLVLLVFVAGGETETSLSFWFISGLTSGILYFLAYLFVLRLNLALIPLALGAGAMLDALQQGLLNGYPSAIPGTVLAMILIGMLSVFWHWQLSQP